MLIELHKYHGYGNDFFVLWKRTGNDSWMSRLSRTVCRRHHGVGADGCVFLRPIEGQPSRFEYRIFNQDGSQAGMSGNGARCACAFLHHQGIVTTADVVLDTLSGPRTLRLIQGQAPRWRYRAGLGQPSFDPNDVPFTVSKAVALPPDDSAPLIAPLRRLEAAGRTVEATLLSMGNPQCQLVLERLPDPDEFRRLGEALERHAAFPDRSNVGFVQVQDRGHLRMLIWERGVGPTHSSGTGACAAGVTAIVRGLCDSPVEVSTATGSQIVEWSPGGEVFLTGQAEYVARILFPWEDS